MIPDETGDCPSASSGMHFDLSAPETPDSPSRLRRLVERCIPFPYFGPRVPVVPVRLDNEVSLLKHKVGLEPSEHSLVHLEVEATLSELVTQEAFDSGHLVRKLLAQALLPFPLPILRFGKLTERRLALFFLHFWAALRLAVPFDHFRRSLLPKPRLSYPLPRLRGMFVAKVMFIAKHRLTDFLSCFRPPCDLTQSLSNFRRSLANPGRHLVFNYNTSYIGRQA
jgi:hypothetical protein